MQFSTHPLNQFTSIATIGIDFLQPAKQFGFLDQVGEHLFACMHILHICCRHFCQYNQSQSVYHQVTFAPTHFFATIVASFFTSFSALCRLAIHNHGAGLRLATFFFAYSFSDCPVQLLPSSSSSKDRKIVINRLPGRKVMWQCPPDTSVLDHIKDAVQYFSPRMFLWPSLPIRLWQVWRNLRPFVIIKVSRVGLV